MTQKDDLIVTMKREASGTRFEAILALLESIPELKSIKKGKTLSFYSGKQIVAALRTHTQAYTGKFVLSVPEGLYNSCPDTYRLARSIWGSRPIDNQDNPGNKESSFPMLIDESSFDIAVEIIERVFRSYAVGGCANVTG